MTLQAIGSREFNPFKSTSGVARAFRGALILPFARAVVSELASIVAEDLCHGRISRTHAIGALAWGRVPPIADTRNGSAPGQQISLLPK